MNILRKKWLDYLLTYVSFILFLAAAKEWSPLWCLPSALFAYYVYRGTSVWLFETDKMKLMMARQLDSLSKHHDGSKSGYAALSIYSFWWTCIYLLALSLSVEVASFWK
ncbi:hypothetical protein OKZ62_001865 [Vibrio navarrensis]|nr:hypothetical protein [Vibrio navarrensis]